MQRYQEGLKESMTGNEFMFDSADALYYDLNKISLSKGDNPKNNNDKCFQYALSVALNYEQIKSRPERISNIRPFIDQYN